MPAVTFKRRTPPQRLLVPVVLAGLITMAGLLGTLETAAQAPGGFGGPPATAQESAPVDITGYWVSLVTEDWIERMSPASPPSGTQGGVGRGRGGAGGVPAIADPCRVYAGGGSMRLPGRLNIDWTDPNTLEIRMDSGSQTRALHFDETGGEPGAPSLQGHTVARWVVPAGGRGRGGRGGTPPEWGSIEAVTTNLTGGHLLTSRSNYSAGAVLTEHFIPHTSFGVDYLTVRAEVQDEGAGGATVHSSTFRREPDGTNFNPGECAIVVP